jgi:protein-disulfide isomerase
VAKPLQLAGLAVVAWLGVALLVVALGPRPAPARGVHTSSRFEGIPQRGTTLGRADAPNRLVVFADLQCPYCRAWETEQLPGLLKDVRAGRLRIDLRLLAFLGPDSRTLASAAAAAAGHNRLWPFVARAYSRQGQENSGYVTAAFVDDAARAAGLTGEQLRREGAGARAQALLAAAEKDAERYRIQGTPSFLAGPRDGPLRGVSSP